MGYEGNEVVGKAGIAELRETSEGSKHRGPSELVSIENDVFEQAEMDDGGRRIAREARHGERERA